MRVFMNVRICMYLCKRGLLPLWNKPTDTYKKEKTRTFLSASAASRSADMTSTHAHTDTDTPVNKAQTRAHTHAHTHALSHIYIHTKKTKHDTAQLAEPKQSADKHHVSTHTNTITYLYPGWLGLKQRN